MWVTILLCQNCTFKAMSFSVKFSKYFWEGLRSIFCNWPLRPIIKLFSLIIIDLKVAWHCHNVFLQQPDPIFSPQVLPLATCIVGIKQKTSLHSKPTTNVQTNLIILSNILQLQLIYHLLQSIYYKHLSNFGLILIILSKQVQFNLS